MKLKLSYSRERRTCLLLVDGGTTGITDVSSNLNVPKVENMKDKAFGIELAVLTASLFSSLESDPLRDIPGTEARESSCVQHKHTRSK